VAGLFSKLYVPVENAFLESFDVVTASTERIDRNVEHVQLPCGYRHGLLPADRRRVVLRPNGDRLQRSAQHGENVSEILRAAEELPEYDFVIVGEGPYRDCLERDAPENVEIRSFLPGRSCLPSTPRSIPS